MPSQGSAARNKPFQEVAREPSVCVSALAVDEEWLAADLIEPTHQPTAPVTLEISTVPRTAGERHYGAQLKFQMAVF